MNTKSPASNIVQLRTYEHYNEAALGEWFLISEAKEGLFCQRENDGMRLTRKLPENLKDESTMPYFYHEEMDDLVRLLAEQDGLIASGPMKGGLAR